MKKVFSLLATVALAFAFTACEDIPAPYEINYEESVVPGAEDVIVEESFASDLGSFSTINTEGNYSWYVNYSCAQVTSYTDDDGDGTKENNPAESWMVSSALDLTEVDSAYFSFDYILRYATNSQMASHYQVLVSKDFNGSDVKSATWTALPLKLVQGSDWDTWYSSGEVQIPSEFCNTPNVYIAFFYKATTKAATWEVKNFSIQQGKVEGQAPSTPDTGGTKNLPYTESFTSSLGAFTSVTVTGGGEWINDFKTAKASNYDSATKLTTPGTIYLVSPAISLENVKTAYLAYESIVNYNKGDENQQVLISKDYAGDPAAATWTLINQTHAAFVDWNTFESLSFAVPAEFIGSTVHVAFRYNAEASGCSTWEVRNFSMTESESEAEEDDTTGELGGLETFANGDFETWSGGKPTHWTPTTTAGNGTLSQSTDAHSGNYSVKVTGSTGGNKRIGYKEMILEAGSYTMQFYTKAATAAGGSVRPGYVPVTDGKVGQYVYGEYTNDLTNTEWVLVTHKFELAAKTTVNLVIMNAKNPGKDVLIDDFTITKD